MVEYRPLYYFELASSKLLKQTLRERSNYPRLSEQVRVVIYSNNISSNLRYNVKAGNKST